MRFCPYLLSFAFSRVSITTGLLPSPAPFHHTLPTKMLHVLTAGTSATMPTHIIAKRLNRPSPPIQLKLCISDYISETHSAAAAIMFPTIIGMATDRLHPRIPVLGALQGVGALTTIIVASLFSSLGISPKSHPLYELVWTRFLPASLSFLLLSPTREENKYSEVEPDGGIGGSVDVEAKTRTGVAAKDEIIAVSIPFIVGCMGSILGCVLSYFYCWLGKDNDFRVHRHILTGRKHFFWQPGHLLLDPAAAAVAAGCLSSNYIGGPVNYFASARIIANDAELPGFANVGASEVLG